MDYETLFTGLGFCVVISPAVLVATLGLSALVGRPLEEQTIIRSMQAAVTLGLTAAIAILGLMLAVGSRDVPIEFGNWVAIDQEHFHFHLKFVFDRLSVPFAILSFLLCGIIGAFTSRYLHRDPGFGRFCVSFAFFLLGMIISSLAGTIETLFLGWELVGLSSALLVAFFQTRPNPVRNGIRVWTVYRVADAAFLLAALTLHNLTGAGDFSILMGTGPWPEGQATLTADQALFVGLLLVVAAAGKSALVPFSGWLPRAMEGPTPSSAVFYGALSVHLGAYLLLRVSPILECSLLLSTVVVTLGLVSALFGAIATRVQTDVKSSLAFASLTQVGIIVAEIGAGLRYVALIHLLGHACLRTLQLLRAPTLLRDYHMLENAIGGHLQHQDGLWGRLPERLRNWLYRFAMQRGYLDGWLNECFVHPFIRLFGWCDRMERAWTDLLSGGHSRRSDDLEVHNTMIEEVRL